MSTRARTVSAVDLFCGAGGLSHGLRQAGIHIAGGFDNDPMCRAPFENNIAAPFFERDVRRVRGEELMELWPKGAVRILAGCAPCQPFSSYRRGTDTRGDDRWPLLDSFARLTRETVPDFVTMENVPGVKSSEVFRRFVRALKRLGYQVSFKSCYCPDFGLAQNRRRLVLVASRFGPIEVPLGTHDAASYRTVRDAIGTLPKVPSGGVDASDELHRSRALSELNLRRIRASKPGGTWRDWPVELRAPCHQRKSGSTFGNVYSRMEWDQPAPTITTMAYNFGTGRFGHPEQDRPITLREAALLQGFPREYQFVDRGQRVNLLRLGRLIGNAVPPPLGRAIGDTIARHVSEHAKRVKMQP